MRNYLFARSRMGFTLVELLVVISIIGVLSSIVFASLSSARVRARRGSAQSVMTNVHRLALICLNSSAVIGLPGPTDVIDPTTTICADVGVDYPTLPANWVFCDGIASGTCGTDVSTQTTGVDFSIRAESTESTSYIICTSSGCTGS